MRTLDVNCAESKVELYRLITITGEKTEAPDIGYLMGFVFATPAIRVQQGRLTKAQNGLEVRF